jgi:hypothetical protein
VPTITQNNALLCWNAGSADLLGTGAWIAQFPIVIAIVHHAQFHRATTLGFSHCPWSAGYRGPAFRCNQERDYVRVIYDQWLLDDGGVDTDADYYADLYPDLNEVD